MVKGTLIAHQTPDGVVGVIFGDVGPEDGSTLVEVGWGGEEVGWISEWGVVYASDQDNF